MADLKNNRIGYKVMFVPNEDTVLWEVFAENPLQLGCKNYCILNSYIDIEDWKEKYRIKFNEWLNEDDLDIFDINHSVNLEMINALIQVNRHLSGDFIYYWFDIDRTYNEHYRWTNCPISGEKLIDLGTEYPFLNRLISPFFPLILPSTATSAGLL